MVAYAPKPCPNQLLQLSDQVNRIACALAQLSNEGSEGADNPNSFDEGNPGRDLSETVRSVIKARRRRTRYFANDLFADPAWDILLDLFAAELLQHRINISSACIGADVPATTALRWIHRLVEDNLIVRHNDPIDKRRAFIELAPETSVAMRQYFAEVGSQPAI